MKGYADGPFGQIHFHRHGDGVPVVLLHQAPTSAVQFAEVFEPLVTRGLQPVAIDAPGFGMSEGPISPPGIEDYASAVIVVVEQLELGSVHLVGHHTGSQVATEVALQRPDLVRSVALHSPAFLNADEVAAFREQMMTFEQNQKVKSDGTHLVEAWEWRANFCSGFQPEIMHRHVIQQLIDIKHGWFAHNAWLNYPHEEKVKSVARPLQTLSNTGDVLFEYAVRIKDIRPDAGFVELGGGTIDFIDEFPEAWADAVAEFALEIDTAETN